MNNKFYLGASACCLLMALLLSMVHLQKKEEALAAQIAPSIIRFHVLANSDSPEDQALKVQVKEMLLGYIYEKLGENAGKEETRAYLLQNREELATVAGSYMKNMGYDYTASVELTENYFPTKTYGDVVFPCGIYETATVTIGSGQGKNWWCVLYPPLCFTDATYGVVPPESKEKLQAMLPEKDFTDLMAKRRLTFQNPSSDYAKGEADLYQEIAPPDTEVQFKFLFMEKLFDK